MGKNNIECPLCKEPIEVKCKNLSYFWICDSCPFVGFEYFGIKNINDLEQILRQ